MTIKRISALCFGIIACSIFFFVACKKEEKKGKISVQLTDNPGDYQQVNVDILQVSIHLVPTSGNGDWIDLPTNAGVYDLLKLQNGIDTSLVPTTAIAAGKITQMRLLLGTKNSVMVDSVVYDLTVPSGSQSGIKLVGPMEVDANQPLDVKLDFDAEQSVEKTGNGKYILKPTIKTL